MNSNNKLLYISLAATLGLFSVQNAWAQNAPDTVLRTQTFDVYQVYVPEVQKKTKEKILPELPKFDTVNPVYTYIVPEQKLSYSYQAVPLRPLALGLDNATSSFENYVKAGMGNLTSILLDAGISSIQTENFQSIIHAKHLSQKGGGIENRRSAQTEISAKGYSQFKNHDVFGGVNFDRRGVRYYGIRPDTLLPQPDLDSIKQVYWNVSGHVGFENTFSGTWKYKPSIQVGYFADKFKANETNVTLDVPVSYFIDSNFTVGVTVNGNFNQYTLNKINYANNAFSVHPYVQINALNSQFDIGVKPTFGSNSEFYFLPDITAKVPLVANKLKLQAGFRGELIQNTFKQIATKNPFINQYTPNLQTRQLKVFGGFDANLSDHMSIGGSVSWNQWNHLPVFVNDYTKTTDGRNFKVLYGNSISALMFDGYFKYQVNENFGVQAFGAWTTFTNKGNLERIYHEPQFKIGGEIFAKPFKGLYVSGKFEYWDRIYYLSAKDVSSKLSPITDLSLQGEYQIIPRLSVFLQLNNVFNNQYNRWYQYDVYGFNIIGGLRLKF